MGLLEILMLGVALVTDAFSVTISNTFAFDDHRVSRLIRMPLFWHLWHYYRAALHDCIVYRQKTWFAFG